MYFFSLKYLSQFKRRLFSEDNYTLEQAVVYISLLSHVDNACRTAAWIS